MSQTLQTNPRSMLIRGLAVSVFLLLGTFVSQAQTPQYYVDNASGTNVFPFSTTTSPHTEHHYLANEFTGAYSGNITKIWFKRGNSTTNPTFTNLTVKLGQSTTTSFPYTTTFTTGLTTCYNASSTTLASGNTNDWIGITLQTPFYYNPSQALIVNICQDGYSGGFYVRYYNTSGGGYRRIYGGSSCSATGGYGADYARYSFGIDMSPALPDDAGISKLLSPVNFCAGQQDIKVNLKNFGTNTLNSVTINWSLNGVPQTAINYTTPMPTLADATITLGSHNFAAGVPVHIVAWTSNPNNTNDSFSANDSLDVTVQPALSGTFTLGGASPDYSDFASAVADLNQYGVCGPVVFNVRSGTYNEQIGLQGIDGASAINTITFQSETGNKADVELVWNASGTGDNYIVALGSAKFVTFKNMTMEATNNSYGRVIYFDGASTDCTFDNLELISPNVNSTSTYVAVVYSNTGTNNDRTTFLNCGIREGSYGMYMYGGGTTSTEDDNLIQGNEFTGQYYRPYYGVYLGKIKFLDNKIYQEPTNTYTYHYPCSFYYGYDSQIERNMIYSDGGAYAYGVYFYYENYYQSGNSIFANNMISILNTTTRTYYGIYGYRDYNTLFAHNTVHINSNYTSSYAVYSYYAQGSEFYNNMFYHTGDGYAWYVNGNGYINGSDYNLFYTAGNNFVYWGGSRASLGALQGASGMDANSISKTVSFKDMYTGDLHLTSPSEDDTDLFGTLLTQVTDDIDGEDRIQPYMGADEACYITPGSVNYDFVDGQGYPAAYAEAPGSIGVHYSVAFPDFDATITMTVSFYSIPSEQLAYQTQLTAQKQYGITLDGIQYINLPSSLQAGTYKIEVNFWTKNSCDAYRDYMPYPSALLIVGEGQQPCVVWPGDVNNDGVVTYVDRRELNLYIFNANLRATWLSGPARYQADSETNPFTYIEWKPQAAAPWYTPEGCYMDTDGNGVVNNMDYIAMKLNWAQTTPWYGGTPKAGTPTAASFAMDQNYPNPFNPSTMIKFAVPEQSHVRLVVTDALGRQVAELVNGNVDQGLHEVQFDGSQLSSGTYIASVTMTGAESGMSFTKTIKMVLSK
ncbi:T9SS type A sorting domain-containing protein [bacterium]|nr:T9SS type A sorting domain-containing protein [bacterium]